MVNLCLFDDADKFVFQRGSLHLALKVFECAVKLQVAFVNDGEVIAEQADFTHAVCGKDDGFSRVPAIADEVYDIARGDDVETVGGFVEYNDVGVVYESCVQWRLFCFMPVESLPMRRFAKASMSRRAKRWSRRVL